MQTGAAHFHQLVWSCFGGYTAPQGMRTGWHQRSSSLPTPLGTAVLLWYCTREKEEYFQIGSSLALGNERDAKARPD